VILGTMHRRENQGESMRRVFKLMKQVVEVTGTSEDLGMDTPEQLKDRLELAIQSKKAGIVEKQIKDLKEYRNYNDVMNTFQDIKSHMLYDAPLMLEWNTWRAMTMLDGGDVKANLKIDDKGQPMSTAQGNMADIVCDYGDFCLAVEVTMQAGQRQYESEGEPVSRHLARLKKEMGKEAYCLFIAPKINEACVAYFYALHTVNISFYGGNSVIVPLELDVFIHIVEQSCAAGYIPNSKQLKGIISGEKKNIQGFTVLLVKLKRISFNGTDTVQRRCDHHQDGSTDRIQAVRRWHTPIL